MTYSSKTVRPPPASPGGRSASHAAETPRPFPSGGPPVDLASPAR